MQKSNRMHRRVAAVLATGCAGLALAGAAHPIDLREWGQKLTANERFVVILGNQAVLDKETQLVWERKPSTTASDWEDAKNLCADGVFAGRRGWRLPNVHELSSLADPSTPGTLALPTGHPFEGVQPANYWTATRHLNSAGQTSGFVQAVSFLTGGSTGLSPTTYSAYQWCVRGGGPITEY